MAATMYRQLVEFVAPQQQPAFDGRRAQEGRSPTSTAGASASQMLATRGIATMASAFYIYDIQQSLEIKRLEYGRESAEDYAALAADATTAAQYVPTDASSLKSAAEFPSSTSSL